MFSFMDRSDSSRVKSDRGHHNRGVAPEGTTRAATDRPVKDRTYLGNRPTVLLAAKTYAKDPLKRAIFAGFCTFEGKNPVLARTVRRCME